MEYIKKIPAIRWEDGEYEEVEEETVEDENIYFYIDFLQPRKFSTYPADLEDKWKRKQLKMKTSIFT